MPVLRSSLPHTTHIRILERTHQPFLYAVRHRYLCEIYNHRVTRAQFSTLLGQGTPMRLLNTRSLSLHEFHEDKIPKYAILSHTWGEDEVTYQDMLNPTKAVYLKAGYAKIEGFARKCRKTYEYAWIDTCCIDKTSSSELSEAINSMYAWYSNAGQCFAYLSDVQDIGEARKGSRWFTRGWTLQELIAPKSLIFYASDWEKLGSKTELAHELSNITSIPVSVLKHGLDDSISAAQKMSWVANRQTTRREDIAYCLLGLFGINMPLLYGEGENAFIRLQEEIIRSTDDQSLFLWLDTHGTDSTYHGLLAESPNHFSGCSGFQRWPNYPLDDHPFSITNTGLQLTVMLLPLATFDSLGTKCVNRIFPEMKLEPEDELYLPLLNTSSNLMPSTIFIKRLETGKNQFARVMTNRRVTLKSGFWHDIAKNIEPSTIFIRQKIILPECHSSHRASGFLIQLGPAIHPEYDISPVSRARWSLLGNFLQPPAILATSSTSIPFGSQQKGAKVPDYSDGFVLVMGYDSDSFRPRPWWNIYRTQKKYADQYGFGEYLGMPGSSFSRKFADRRTVTVYRNSGLLNGCLTNVIRIETTKAKGFKEVQGKLGPRKLEGRPSAELLESAQADSTVLTKHHESDDAGI
jgi:Heterokaryon incompatibility protein (HET)